MARPLLRHSTIELVASAALCASLAHGQEFIQTSGPTGGNVLGITVDGKESSTVWASTSTGNIFRSEDSGGTWSWIGTSGLSGNAFLAQIVSINDGTLFLRDNTHIYRSTDEGASWSLAPIDFDNVVSTDIVVDGPAVFAPLREAANSPDRLFGSHDSGATWIPMPLPYANVSDVFARDDVLVVSPAGFSGGELQRSLNLGQIWIPIIVSDLPNDQYIRFATGQPALVLQCLFTGRYFRSSNVGISWDEITPPFAGGFFELPLGVADGQTTMYAAFKEQNAVTIYRSDDDGMNWQATQPAGLADTVVSSSMQMPMVSLDPSTALLGYGFSGFGVYRSTDFGTRWTPSNEGLISTTVDAVGAVGDVLLASTVFFAHNYRSDDGGATWDEQTTLPNIISYESISAATVFAGSQGSGVFRSQDAGLSWTPANAGLPHYSSMSGNATQPINDLAAHNSFLFAATGGGTQSIVGDDHCGCTSTASGDGVYRSSNNGATWQRVSNGLPINMFYFGVPILRPILALQPVDGALLAATQSHGVYRTTNNGGNWTAVNGIGGASDFAVFDSDVYAATGDGSLFRSTDGGLNWSIVATDLPANFSYRKLHVHEGVMYALAGSTQAAAVYGIYSSTNASNWQSASSALANVPVSDITSRGHELVVATVGRGVWIRPEAASCSADIDDSGMVDVVDLLTLLSAWGPCADEECPADFDNNGAVGVLDLLMLLSAWGECP